MKWRWRHNIPTQTTLLYDNISEEHILLGQQHGEWMSWKRVGWTIDFLALDTQVSVQLRRVGDQCLSVDEFKQASVTGLVSLTIQHHCNTEQHLRNTRLGVLETWVLGLETPQDPIFKVLVLVLKLQVLVFTWVLKAQSLSLGLKLRVSVLSESQSWSEAQSLSLGLKLRVSVLSESQSWSEAQSLSLGLKLRVLVLVWSSESQSWSEA